MFRNIRNYSIKLEAQLEVHVNSISILSNKLQNYIAVTLKVKVSLDRTYTVLTILDLRAKVNIVTRNLTDKLRLLVRPDMNLVIVVYIGNQ